MGKDPQSWVSSHSNLSFRTLSAPHNGPGDHSRQPPPPVSTLLGNGLFLPPLGVGWGHLQEGPVLVGSSDPGSQLSGKLETSALKGGRGLQPGRPKTEPEGKILLDPSASLISRLAAASGLWRCQHGPQDPLPSAATRPSRALLAKGGVASSTSPYPSSVSLPC